MEHVQPINGKYAVYLKEGQPVRYSHNKPGLQFWSSGTHRLKTRVRSEGKVNISSGISEDIGLKDA